MSVGFAKGPAEHAAARDDGLCYYPVSLEHKEQVSEGIEDECETFGWEGLSPEG